MLKKILIGVVALIAIFVVVVALQPSEYRIERSATVSAPAGVVFARVNDFRKWEDWSPWAKLDPDAKATFSGPPSGEGTAMEWDGNGEVGKGKMTLTESRPGEMIRIRLDFKEPFEDTSTAEFSFKPKGEQTEVTWAMFGKNNFVGRAMCLFLNQDAMVGGYFEKGLASLKRVAEASAKQQ